MADCDLNDGGRSVHDKAGFIDNYGSELADVLARSPHSTMVIVNVNVVRSRSARQCRRKQRASCSAGSLGERGRRAGVQAGRQRPRRPLQN